MSSNFFHIIHISMYVFWRGESAFLFVTNCRGKRFFSHDTGNHYPQGRFTLISNIRETKGYPSRNVSSIFGGRPTHTSNPRRRQPWKFSKSVPPNNLNCTPCHCVLKSVIATSTYFLLKQILKKRKLEKCFLGGSVVMYEHYIFWVYLRFRTSIKKI